MLTRKRFGPSLFGRQHFLILVPKIARSFLDGTVSTVPNVQQHGESTPWPCSRCAPFLVRTFLIKADLSAPQRNDGLGSNRLSP